jgi:hypothetical protein
MVSRFESGSVTPRRRRKRGETLACGPVLSARGALGLGRQWQQGRRGEGRACWPRFGPPVGPSEGERGARPRAGEKQARGLGLAGVFPFFILSFPKPFF